MAKCPICNSRKGKRRCIVVGNGYICSLCCGGTQEETKCSDCSFYKSSKLRRKYSEVPSFSVREMYENSVLQRYSNAIEGALCAFDRINGYKIKDEVAIKIFEALIDKYYFKDSTINFESEIIADGFSYIEDVIKTDLNNVPEEILVKILGVLHFVSRRQTEGGREYLTLIHNYVGERIGKNIWILPKYTQ